MRLFFRAASSQSTTTQRQQQQQAMTITTQSYLHLQLLSLQQRHTIKSCRQLFFQPLPQISLSNK